MDARFCAIRRVPRGRRRGHLDVHQHDVRLQPLRAATASSPSLASPTTARLLGLEDQPETGAHEGLIVGEDDS